MDANAPIAVVGIACRLSGGAHDTETLWSVLEQGRTTWTDVPEDRYNWKSFDHPSQDATTAFKHRGGHFLQEDVATFDAAFFAISHLEAKSMDPQQRHALEVAKEALDSAGIPLENIKGTDTGVYVATFNHDYENMIYKDAISIPKYTMTGVGQAIVSNRISYTFDLRGPSMTIDTGCSGSLVALHQACQSLRLGESACALVGGTNLILNPDTMIPMHNLHFLNASGRCLSFDEMGAGYGRGEGVVMLVIKPLHQALVDNDPVRAIIRATAINQDGKTRGITSPSMNAQQSLIRTAYRRAGLDPADTSYVEAHGTGTVKGDLVEVEALHTVFVKESTRSTPLYVGSSKANFGHTESSSGLVGVVKTILTLEKSAIPGTPSVQTLRTGLMPFQDRLEIPTSNQPWPLDSLRRASINSFAYGGTNAHVILDGATTTDALVCQQPDIPQLHLLTAKTRVALQKSISRLHDWAKQQHPDQLSIPSLAYTLCDRRSRMQWRYAFVASNKDQLLSTLHPLPRPCSRSNDFCEPAFVFTGQGSQWYAMGRELMAAPCFNSSLRSSEQFLKSFECSWNLIDELLRDEQTSRVTECEVAQPMLTAIQIALVQLLQYLGVRPKAVVGHSSGEIAAAFAAGALDQKTAMKIAYQRGLAVRQCREIVGRPGTMAAIGLSEEDATPLLSEITGGRAVIACKNSSANVTISGDSTAIEQVLSILKKTKPYVFAKKLNVDVAYHSHHMQCVAETYLNALCDIEFTSPDPFIKFFSSVTGRVKNSDFGASYWVSNLLSKVDFQGALQELFDQWQDASPGIKPKSVCSFIEVGPHKTLSSYTRDAFDDFAPNNLDYAHVSMLSRSQNAYHTVLESMGQHLQRGGTLSTLLLNNLLNSVHENRSTVLTTLPNYCWDHSNSFWCESRVSRQHRLRQYPYHDLCGIRSTQDTVLEPAWRLFVSPDRIPWLKDHCVDGVMIFPGAGYLAMAIEAKKQIVQSRYGNARIIGYEMEEVDFSNLLQISDSQPEIELRLHLTSTNPKAGRKIDEWEEFRISSIQDDGTTTHHCSGRLKVNAIASSVDDVGSHDEEHASTRLPSDLGQFDASETNDLQQWDPAAIYKLHEVRGHYWGPSFARISQLKVNDRIAAGTISIPNMNDLTMGGFMQPHVIHPSTLDSMIHSTLLIFSRTCNRSTMFPVSIGHLTLRADIPCEPDSELDFLSQIHILTKDEIHMEVDVPSNDGNRPYVSIRNGRIRGRESTQSTTRGEIKSEQAEKIYTIQWRADIDQEYSPTQSKDLPGVTDLTIMAQDATLDLNNTTIAMIRRVAPLLSKSQVKPQHWEYLTWMQDLIKAYPEVDLATQPTLSAYTGVEKETLSVIDRYLESILEGRHEAMSLYLDHKLVKRLYMEDWSAMKCFEDIQSYIDLLTFKTPGIKVLEIGAGTGSLTYSLLSAVCPGNCDKISQYDFTDISPAFLEHSKTLLHEWSSIMRHKVLDIAKDPTLQGFQAYAYDVVIAYNSLHVTESVDVAISNARKLLKPGGRLVLLEMTTLHPFVNAIYGLLPGWYMHRTDGRQGPPLLSIQQWSERLRKQGFSGLGYTENDFDGVAQRMSVMVARAAATEINDSQQTLRLMSGGDQHKYLNLRDILTERCSQSKNYVVASQPNSTAPTNGLAIIISNADTSHVNTGTPASNVTGLLWVTSKPTEQPPNTLKDQVLSKSSDDEQVPISTLLVTEDALSNPLDTANLILNILERSFGSTSTDSPRELTYAVKGEQILISRLMPFQINGVKQHVDAKFEHGSHNADHGTVKSLSSSKATGKAINISSPSTYVVTGRDIKLMAKACDLLSFAGASHIAISPNAPLSVSDKQWLIGKLYMSNLLAKTAVIQHSDSTSPSGNVLAQLPDWPSVRGLFLCEPEQSSPPSTDGLDFVISLEDMQKILSDEMLSTLYGHRNSGHPVQLSIYMPLEVKSFNRSAGSFEALREAFKSALQSAMRDQISRQVVVGISGMPLNETQKNTFTAHVSQSNVNKIRENPQNPPRTALQQPLAERNLEDAVSLEDAQTIVRKALLEKILSLAAIETDDDMNINIPVEDIGLDSFMRFRLRNWMFATFKATLEPNEIVSAPSITCLADQILERSSMTTWKPQAVKPSSEEKNTSKAQTDASLSTSEFPAQPLPTLENTLQAYLEAVRPFCTEEERRKTEQEIDRFKSPESISNLLQGQLQTLACDKTIPNWLSHLYMERRYLKLRSPMVAHQTYFGTHPMGSVHQSQSERAAILTLTAMRFREEYRAGTLPPQHLGGKVVDSESYKWLFNTCRVPHIEKDEIVYYDGLGNDYVVAMRCGHAFKIELASEGCPAPMSMMQAAFEHVLQLPLVDSEIGILTADGRDEWAQNRTTLIEFSTANKQSISIIEAAMFVICLDDQSPDTEVERFRQFLFANSTNRWYDKTLQFVVCQNGASGSVLEHATLDGVAVSPLHTAINEAIQSFQPDNQPPTSSPLTIAPLPITIPPPLSNTLPQLTKSLKTRSHSYTFHTLSSNALTPSFIQAQKLPLQSTIQLAIQLASTRFFKSVTPAFETVSLAHFRAGRVDVNPIIGSAMHEFLTAATASPAERTSLRRLAIDATREHTRSLTRVHMGAGYNRHLLALEWMLHDAQSQSRSGMETPAFFTDASYGKSKPGRVLTSTFDTGWAEGGFVYPVPGGVLVYFQTGGDGVRYSVFGHGVDACGFVDVLEQASAEVRAILER